MLLVCIILINRLNPETREIRSNKIGRAKLYFSFSDDNNRFEFSMISKIQIIVRFSIMALPNTTFQVINSPHTTRTYYLKYVFFSSA